MSDATKSALDISNNGSAEFDVILRGQIDVKV